LSISNIRNQGQRSDIKFPITQITGTPPALTTRSVAVSMKNLNRTNVNVASGGEWYLRGTANACEPRWRVGFDAGGRIGSVRGEFNEIQHRTDVLGGVFIGLHTDLEIPCGCCTFLAGLRAEWGYNWMDILQLQNNSDLQDVNLLLTAGVRF
jgi:hypothetical protein